MCIALVTTAHPDYPLILIDNRDEYLLRPTAPATWWEPPNSHVLGGRDLYRSVQGTWLGVTKQGRIAVLTNFREEGQVVEGNRSRGAIVNAFLSTPPHSDETPEKFAKRQVEDDSVKGVGGFSLLFGQLRRPGSEKDRKQHDGLAIVSNRTPDVHGLVWVARQSKETVGLSNSHYGDRSWPKVVEGEQLLQGVIAKSLEEREEQDSLIERLFELLSVDRLRPQEEGEHWEIYLRQLRNSIFVPAIGRSQTHGKSADAIAAANSNDKVQEATSGVYGTQKQTIVLVNRQGVVTFVERTLYDSDGKPKTKGDRDRKYEFDIEGW